MLNMNTSETLCFHPLLLSGISSIFEIRNRLVHLKKQIFKFIRPRPNSTFNVLNPQEIKLLTRLQVRLSHLREQFRHNFQDSLDPFCNCSRHIETTINLFFHRSNYSNQRKTPFEKISNIKRSLLNQNDSIIVETLFFGWNSLNDK